MRNNRRSFLKLTSTAAAFFGLGSSQAHPKDEWLAQLNEKMATRPKGNASVINLKKPAIGQVKVAMLGLGNRGTGQAKLVNALFPNKAKITAICDIREKQVQKTLGNLKEKGQTPATYSGSAEAWKEMVQRDDIDLVVICTPWKDHVPMALYCMDQGKHVAVEVPAAWTLEECWAMVDKAEETQLNCMMLENVCYGDEELWVLNMIQQGVFGTLTYGEAAYIHNLRDSLLGDQKYYDNWRMKANMEQDGNLYPTHGLGPVAQYMDINRGDKFERLVSMSSLEASLSELTPALEPSNEFYQEKDIAHGDMNNTIIKTAMGRTILVQHDVVTPRPYNRINAIAGTRAFHEGYPSRLSIAGKGHSWLEEPAFQEYREKYKHPIWNKLEAEIKEHGGHGGMDFVQIYRLIDCLNNGWPLDMDVYDGAAWSSLIPLTKLSIELGNIPIKCPDFTRGDWKGKRELGIFANV
ncbi:MAG: Gfo/Idh/MocA family oxidoreductase [Saprospiraceae bacterium]|nr:Gfo/Idh/MocA family oxidoreductase [Saprospiraceae bacterium]